MDYAVMATMLEIIAVLFGIAALVIRHLG